MKQTINKEHSRIKSRTFNQQSYRDDLAITLKKKKKENKLIDFLNKTKELDNRKKIFELIESDSIHGGYSDNFKFISELKNIFGNSITNSYQERTEIEKVLKDFTSIDDLEKQILSDGPYKALKFIDKFDYWVSGLINRKETIFKIGLLNKEFKIKDALFFLIDLRHYVKISYEISQHCNIEKKDVEISYLLPNRSVRTKIGKADFCPINLEVDINGEKIPQKSSDGIVLSYIKLLPNGKVYKFI